MRNQHKELESIQNKNYDLKMITILVFSKNRHYFLKRQINYWKNENIKLLIFDESPNWLDVDLKMYKNIEYHNVGTFSERCLAAIDFIDTPYTMISADDDFIIKSSLYKCLQFLENNNDIACCGGQFMNFQPIKNQIQFQFSYKENQNFYNKSDIISERVELQTSPYKMTSWYALKRSNQLKKSLYTLGKLVDISSPQINASPEITEVILEITNSILGKSISLKDILYLRSVESASTWVSNWGGLRCWMLTNHYKKSRELVIANICKSISEVTNLDTSEIRSLFLVGFRNYALNQNPSLFNKLRLLILRFLWDLFLNFPKIRKLFYYFKSRLFKKQVVNESFFKPDLTVTVDGAIKNESDLLGIEEDLIHIYNPIKNFSKDFFIATKVIEN
jgi:glycosyltransferase domain-containing protein